mmetsp:Transcript_24740/g.21921  ORF Transcript_24740/g.21921 Transcript_24740/m.21921 type:complete len:145 (+) Transcript_24740:899-1333(+)
MSFFQRNKINNATHTVNGEPQFDINDTFIKTNPDGSSMTILSGLVKSGSFSVGKQYQIGPNSSNKFTQVSITSIHVDACQRETAVAGELACFVVAPVDENVKLNKENIKTGMSVLSLGADVSVFSKFEAKVMVPHHSTTIKKNY